MPRNPPHKEQPWDLSPATPNPIDVLGVKVHPMTKPQFVGILVKLGTSEDRNRVYNVNVRALNLMEDHGEFRSWINQAELVFCDGAGVQLAARFLGLDIPERLSVMDWIDDFLFAASKTGVSIFLLGDEPGVAELCANTIRRRHPDTRLVGTYHGFFNKDGPENDAVISMIGAAQPDVVLVGMGMPIQEQWIEDNIHQLGAITYVPVGAAFRWYSGIDRLAPQWMARHSLEWVWRLTRHPIRYFDRYVLGNLRFAVRLVRYRFTIT